MLRFWEPSALPHTPSAVLYVIVQAPKLTPFFFLWQGAPHACPRQLYDHCASLKEFALITTFSLLYAAGASAKIWTLNAATYELTGKSILVSSPSGAH
jgi:hypothetical protein